MSENMSFRRLLLDIDRGTYLIHLLDEDDVILATAESRTPNRITGFTADTTTFRRNECMQQCVEDTRQELEDKVTEWKSELDPSPSVPVAAVSCE